MVTHTPPAMDAMKAMKTKKPPDANVKCNDLKQVVKKEKKQDSITSLRKELADVKRENKHLNKIIQEEGKRHKQEMFVALKLVDD